MPLPEPVRDVCQLTGDKWLLNPRLASMLTELDGWAGDQFQAVGIPWPGLWIISGQRDLTDGGSLHERCPSDAADLRIGNVAASISANAMWDWLGARWMLLGGRWGGQFQERDENHFDLGVGN